RSLSLLVFPTLRACTSISPLSLHDALPIWLIAELDRVLPRSDAVRRLELVLRVVVENYEEYKDYNATTSQSDYGENLHVLLDFLDRKSTRLNSSHQIISYAVFCLKKKKEPR